MPTYCKKHANGIIFYVYALIMPYQSTARLMPIQFHMHKSYQFWSMHKLCRIVSGMVWSYQFWYGRIISDMVHHRLCIPLFTRCLQATIGKALQTPLDSIEIQRAFSLWDKRLLCGSLLSRHTEVCINMIHWHDSWQVVLLVLYQVLLGLFGLYRYKG